MTSGNICHTGDAPGIKWVGARDAAQPSHSAQDGPTESDLAPVSPVPRGDPVIAVESEDSFQLN